MQRPVMVIVPEGIMQKNRKINHVETLAVGAWRKHTSRYDPVIHETGS